MRGDRPAYLLSILFHSVRYFSAWRGMSSQPGPPAGALGLVASGLRAVEELLRYARSDRVDRVIEFL
jgi:hypothetical protein